MTLRGKAIFFVLALVLFVLDVGSKYVVFAAVERDGTPSSLHGGDHVIEVVPGFFYLTRVYNPGGLWGIGQTGALSTILVIFRAIAVPLLVWMAATTPASNRVVLVALGLFCAGALGNLYDNLLFPDLGVRDFLDFFFFGPEGYHYPTFNVADASIVSAACLLALDMLFRKKPTRAVTGVTEPRPLN